MTNLQNKTVPELKEIVKEMKIEAVGIWKMNKKQLISLIEENTPVEEIVAVPVIEEIIEESIEEIIEEVIVEEEKPKPKRVTKGKGVSILRDGMVEVNFDTTYKCSEYISKVYELSYKAADVYVVGKLKGREVKIPHEDLEQFEFKYTKDL